jgi:ABC-type multidrug transport system ATPase subunit
MSKNQKLSESSLDIIDLTKCFTVKNEVKVVLDRVNFSFKAGKIYALIAPNGSGKTTLMKCLSGISLYKGVVSYKNTKVSGDFNSEIVYSPSIPLFEKSPIRVLDYLFEVCVLRGLNFKDVKSKFENTSTFSLRNKICLELSTGEKKLFQFFLDTLTNPKVLIFDEPLNGLDHDNREFLLHRLRIFGELGKIVIFSTHILSDLESLVDEILILKDCKIISFTNTKTNDFPSIYKKHFPDSNQENFWKEF